MVRRDDRYLLVHERKHGQRWYLPAGRVEPGEAILTAAARETLEETGIRIRLTGVIRIEHSPGPSFARLRIIFLAEAIDDTPPKSRPDDESLGAAWVRSGELNQYSLRGGEVRDILEYVEAGGPIYPLTLVQAEGQPFRIVGPSPTTPPSGAES